MKRNLRNMKNQIPDNQNEIRQMASKVDPSAIQNVQDALNQYQGKSDDELMSTLKQLTQQEKASGTLDEQNIQQFAQQLSPMLNAQQRQRLQSILQSIKE